MNIIELINKANLMKKDFILNYDLFESIYYTLLNQLLILAQENSGNLPNEFILSDGNQILINSNIILKFFNMIDIKVDSINNGVSIDIILDENIPRTTYADKYYILYHVKLLS